MAYFYAHSTENIIIALTSVFNNIKVHQYDLSGVDTGISINVPISFGPLDTAFVRRKANLNEDNIKYYAQYPKMGLILKNVYYDKKRAISSNETLYYSPEDQEYVDMTDFITQIQPSPYNFQFELQCRTLYTQDLTQIYEQILPFFNPQNTIRVKEFSFLNLERDLKVIVDEWPLDFMDVLDSDERRTLQSNVSITVEGFLYRKFTSDDAKIIKSIKANYYLAEGSLDNVDFNNFNISAVDTTEITGGPSTSGLSDNILGKNHAGDGLEFKRLIAGDGIIIDFAPNIITISTSADNDFTGYNQNLDTSASPIFAGLTLENFNGFLKGVSGSISAVNISTTDVNEGINLYYRDERSLHAISGTANRISYNNSTGVIDIDTSYLGQTSITTLGTITTGTWYGTKINIAYGGTNLSTSGSPNQILGMNSIGSGYEYKTLVAGTNVSITHATNTITISTSVSGGGGSSSYNQNLDTSATPTFDGVIISGGNMSFDTYAPIISGTNIPVFNSNNGSGYIFLYDSNGVPEFRISLTNNSGNQTIYRIDLTAV